MLLATMFFFFADNIIQNDLYSAMKCLDSSHSVTIPLKKSIIPFYITFFKSTGEIQRK